MVVSELYTRGDLFFLTLVGLFLALEFLENVLVGWVALKGLSRNKQPERAWLKKYEDVYTY